MWHGELLQDRIRYGSTHPSSIHDPAAPNHTSGKRRRDIFTKLGVDDFNGHSTSSHDDVAVKFGTLDGPTDMLQM